MAAKSTGTKITGSGRLNHMGSAARIYSSTRPPTAKPDHVMRPLMRQSHSTEITAGSSMHTDTTNITPMRLTSSWWGCSSGG